MFSWKQPTSLYFNATVKEWYGARVLVCCTLWQSNMAIENPCKSGLMGKSPINGGFRLTRGYINKLYHVISISTLPPATASVTAFADGQIDLTLVPSSCWYCRDCFAWVPDGDSVFLQILDWIIWRRSHWLRAGLWSLVLTNIGGTWWRMPREKY